MHTRLVATISAVAFFAAAGSVQAQGGDGVPALAPLYYTQHCATCHDNPDATRAPSREALRQRPPEAIYDALTKGAMATQGKALSDSMKRVLAAFLSGRPPGTLVSPDASAMPNRCAVTPLGNPLARIAWNGWGRDPSNSRFQPAPGLAAAQIPRLTLKWAFGFPNASSAYSQPLLAGGRVYAGSDAGHVYALDAATGCVYWSFAADAGVRTAISIGQVGGTAPRRYAIYFGDIVANVYAVDAESGKLRWKHKADDHPLARITGAPTLYEGRLFVPITSLEEASGGHPSYPCCTFRGSLAAYDASTGKQLWKTYTIATEPKPTRKTSIGTQLHGPSGAGVWAAPAIDPVRRLAYITTGDAYSAPADAGTDAVIAIELESGKIRWTKQVTPNDIWLVGCRSVRQPGDSQTCPEKMGADVDFGSSASVHTLPGKTVVIAQQKSGIVWALDPDRNGEIIWQQRIGTGPAVQFGHATDEQHGYFASPDSRSNTELGGLWALKLATGERVWRVPPSCPGTGSCVSAHLAAVTAMPGVVFAGTADGIVRAYATTDGAVLWQYNTAREYETVNRVLAKGGSLSGPGPVIGDGLVLMNSGYVAIGGNGPGNVLLAFAVN